MLYKDGEDEHSVKKWRQSILSDLLVAGSGMATRHFYYFKEWGGNLKGFFLKLFRSMGLLSCWWMLTFLSRYWWLKKMTRSTAELVKSCLLDRAGNSNLITPIRDKRKLFFFIFFTISHWKYLCGLQIQWHHRRKLQSCTSACSTTTPKTRKHENTGRLVILKAKKWRAPLCSMMNFMVITHADIHTSVEHTRNQHTHLVIIQPAEFWPSFSSSISKEKLLILVF